MSGLNTHLIIKKALNRVQKDNPAYSVRALARDLKLSPSYVSRMLKGEKKLPADKVNLLIKVLNLDDLAIVMLKKALVLESVEDRGLSMEMMADAFQFDNHETFSQFFLDMKDATQKQYSVMDHWKYLTLYELIACDNFVSDFDWIAKKLNLKPAQIEEGLQLLIQVGLVEHKDGKYTKVTDKIYFTTTDRNNEVLKMHRNAVQMVYQKLVDKKVLDYTPGQERTTLFNTLFMAGNPQSIAKAREKIRSALKEVIEILSEGEKTDVFLLCTQLFPITVVEPKK
jgi:uncharacterized protein (TIGR02147 family)